MANKGINNYKWKQILWKRNRFCHWCCKLLTKSGATVDHLIPLGEGGEDSPQNCVLSCYSCNHERGKVTDYLSFVTNKLPKTLEIYPTRKQHYANRMLAFSGLIDKWYKLHKRFCPQIAQSVKEVFLRVS